MFFWSLYVFHASSTPYTLKEEMNDESTEKYFQKKKQQQQQQQQQNKTKRKLTSSMTPQYTIHLYMYYFLFWPWMILLKVLSQIQILRLTCSIDFHRRHLNTIVMSATIIPPPTRLTHNVTLMFRNFQASAGNNTSCWSSSHHLRIGLLDQYDTNTEQTSFREIN